MTGLRDLQADFQAYLMGRANGMAARVRDSSRADAATLLAVYGDAYVARLIEALGMDFPVLQALLGEVGFADLIGAYVRAHPSTHPSIRWAGRHLPGFLSAAAPWRERPALSELAALEAALRDAFDAPGGGVATLDAIAAVPSEAWPSLTLALVPSFRRLTLAWQVHNAWEESEEGAHQPAEPKPAEAAIEWAVWRQGLVTQYRSLEVDEAWALDAVAEGRNFADLCEGLCRWHGEDGVAARAVGLMQAWLQQTMIAAIAWDEAGTRVWRGTPPEL
ncbi:MAG: DUF2063 domain-containing protein [Alphaproteobacteria bacterium]|nr:DUF2063 domain-containing protein [Alphaproteobacteria bacterium]